MDQSRAYAQMIVFQSRFKKPANSKGPRDIKPCEACIGVNGSSSGRNLVVCIDGTSNQFSDKNTNVVELYSRLVKNEKQLTFYNSGIGTYATPSWKSPGYWRQVVEHNIDLAIAWRFERILISAYRWLSDNYREGDSIFLFGFSRGAYQVRSLSAMIEKVGLIHKGNEDQIPFAFELYAASTDPASTDKNDRPEDSASTLAGKNDSDKPDEARTFWQKFTTFVSKITNKLRFKQGGKSRPATTPNDKCKRFKETFSRSVKVHFVGAWDTVSSVGIVRDKTLPGTTTGMSDVCAFRHALALDESRVKFLPEYANGGDSGASAVNDTSPSNVKEVWFAGSHSDIGGGSTDNRDMDQFGPALRWMTYEARNAGLRIQTRKDQWIDLDPTESMSLFWRPLELVPVKRLSYKTAGSTTLRPHYFGPRQLKEGHRVHESVFDRMEQGYRPKALIFDPYNWDMKKEAYEQIKELDPYGVALRLLQQLKDSPFLDEDMLSMASREDVHQSLRETANPEEILYSALEKNPASTDQQLRSLSAITGLMLSLSPGFRRPLADVKLLASKIASSGAQEDFSKSQGFLERVASAEVVEPLRGHSHAVFSVAVSPDGKTLVSGSSDRTVGLWDLDSGKAKFLEGHKDPVFSVAFSPDGTKVASASVDSSVRVWDVDGGQSLKTLAHTSVVQSVDFSPDGKKIVSGCDDCTIRVWDIDSGEESQKFEKHKGPIMSAAFSLDGSQIVSASADQTIRVWNIDNGESSEPFEGHTDVVRSAELSPDGKTIVSGSEDCTIRVWDVNSREQLQKLDNHSGTVMSVAFSPDGKRFVSGARDETILVWNVGDEKPSKPFEGHTGAVRSVKFSADGKRIVSGSGDCTIRSWDVNLNSDCLPDFEWLICRYSVVSVGGQFSNGQEKPDLTRAYRQGEMCWALSSSTASFV